MGIVIPFIWDVLTKIKYFHSKFLLLSVKSCLAHIWVDKQPFREEVGGAEVVTNTAAIVEVLYLWSFWWHRCGKQKVGYVAPQLSSYTAMAMQTSLSLTFMSGNAVLSPCLGRKDLLKRKYKNLGRNPCYLSLFVVGEGYRKIDETSKRLLRKIYIFKEETEDNTCKHVKVML